MEEIWKKIPGIPDAYEVSSFGRVRTWYPPYRSYGHLRDEPVQKVVNIGKKGYRQVTLTLPDRRKHFRVSHLVLMAFDGPRPPGHEASHLDGNKLRDVPENLLWETGEDNRAREEIKPHPKHLPIKKDEAWKQHARERDRKSTALREGKRKEQGVCIKCGKEKNKYKNLCDSCREVERNRKRGKKRSPGLRKAQRERLELGVCIRCSGVLGLHSRYCDACYAKRVAYRHPRWEPGSRGRPPKAWLALLPEMDEETT